MPCCSLCSWVRSYHVVYPSFPPVGVIETVSPVLTSPNTSGSKAQMVVPWGEVRVTFLVARCFWRSLGLSCLLLEIARDRLGLACMLLEIALSFLPREIYIESMHVIPGFWSMDPKIWISCSDEYLLCVNDWQLLAAPSYLQLAADHWKDQVLAPFPTFWGRGMLKALTGTPVADDVLSYVDVIVSIKSKRTTKWTKEASGLLNTWRFKEEDMITVSVSAEMWHMGPYLGAGRLGRSGG